MINDNKFEDYQDSLNSAFNNKRTKKDSMLVSLWAKNYQGEISIRFNELTNQIEIEGLPHPKYPWSIWLLQRFGWDVSETLAEQLITAIGLENAYHPIREYLKKIAKAELPSIRIDNLSTRYFGTNNPLYDIFVEKFLISAVARVMEPGCAIDAMLVLEDSKVKHQQGIGKTRFFEELCGSNWFKTSSMVSSHKDELMVLHSSWFLEWGEINTGLTNKQLSWIKNYISVNNDTFRAPYDKRVQTHPRHSVLVGTTNDADILVDPTGNRRFWIIPVEIEEIDIETLKRERDRLWKTAYFAYIVGEEWRLNDEQKRQNDQNNQNYTLEDPWVNAIMDYLSKVKASEVTTSDILVKGLGLETSQINRRNQMRINKILRSLGYSQQRNKKGRYWVKEE